VGAGGGKAGYEVKGTLVRAYIREVEKLGLAEEVATRVSADTRAQMRELPLPSLWLDGSVIEELINAVDAVRGVEAVRTVTKQGQLAILPFLRPFIGGILRLFGTSPATLFSRMNQMSSNMTRGPEITWKSETDQSGELRVAFPMRKNLPRNVFIGFESGVLNIIEMCDKKGAVEDARIVEHGSVGLIRASWT
jgi:hypothetical protein